MQLHELKPPRGARKSRRRVGRGSGSGRGKTSGRGHKGQKARSGVHLRPGFEGGQMPLQRRIPKRGFTPIKRREYLEINVCRLPEFAVEQALTPESLLERRLLKTKHCGVKLLGGGEVTGAFQVKVHKATPAAVKKVEAAGGKVELL